MTVNTYRTCFPDVKNSMDVKNTFNYFSKLNFKMIRIIEDILSTRKLRKYKYSSPRNMKDHLLIFERIKYNGIKMDFVSEYMDREFGTKVKYVHLLSMANNLSRMLDIRLDRLAKRNRNALLCWYAENWALIQPHIKEQKNYIDDESFALQSSIKDSTSDDDNIRNSISETIIIDPSDIRQLLNYH